MPNEFDKEKTDRMDKARKLVRDSITNLFLINPRPIPEIGSNMSNILTGIGEIDFLVEHYYELIDFEDANA